MLEQSTIKTNLRPINLKGDIIDPKTKRVLVPKENYIPPPVPPPAPPPTETPPAPPQAPVAIETPKDDGLGVLDQIKATKRRLKDLEKLRKLKIEEKKRELELLKKQ